MRISNGVALVQLGMEYVRGLTPSNNIFGGDSSGDDKPVLQRNPWFAKVKCSSFVSLLVTQCFEIYDDDLKALFGARSPTAARYFDGTVAGRIGNTNRVNEVEVGDVLFIKYDELRNGFSGHSAIVAHAPELTDEPFGEFEVWKLHVVDSTRTSHGKGDTRRLADGTDTGGVGSGTMRLLVAKGFVVGYLWSATGASSLSLAGQGLELVFGKIPRVWKQRKI